jgi:putative nucleotidyltransferase with HDIG domain
MAKILVIDSDPQMGKALSNHLSQHGFQAASVLNGVDAAKLLNHDMPDLTIIDQDVSLTGIKTAQILRIKPENMKMPILLGLKPGAPEHTRKILKSAMEGGVSWVIARPYNPLRIIEKIHEQLDKSAKSQKPPLTKDELSFHIRKQIRTLTDLPTLSPAQQKLINILSVDDDKVDVDGLIEAIQSDQGLSMRTLRIARSAGYGFQGNLLPTAVTFLGMKIIRQIVQSAAILDVFQQDETYEGALDFRAFWEHSMACAMIMQLISRDNRASKHFMAGLLHDVGKLILDFSFPPFAKAIDQQARKTGQPREQVEKDIIGINHAEIGQEIATLWNLPNEISESIANHHHPGLASRHKLLTGLVYTADVIARKMEIGESGNFAPAEITDPFAAKIRLPMPMQNLLEKKEEITQKIDSILSS